MYSDADDERLLRETCVQHIVICNTYDWHFCTSAYGWDSISFSVQS